MSRKSIILPEAIVLYEKYKQLRTYRAVAELYGCSLGTIHSRITGFARGEPQKPPNPPKPSPRDIRGLTSIQIEVIAKDCRTLQEIANEITKITGESCSRERVRQTGAVPGIDREKKPDRVKKGYKLAEYPISRKQMVNRYNAGESAYDITHDFIRTNHDETYYAQSIQQVILAYAEKHGIALRPTRAEKLALKKQETINKETK